MLLYISIKFYCTIYSVWSEGNMLYFSVMTTASWALPLFLKSYLPFFLWVFWLTNIFSLATVTVSQPPNVLSCTHRFLKLNSI